MNNHFCNYELPNWVCNICGNQPIKNDLYYTLAPDFPKDTGFNPERFSVLYTLEANNFWFRARNKLIIGMLKKYFKEAQSFLEIGCGTAYVLNGIHNAMPNLKLYGSDVYLTSLPYASSRLPKAELFQMDATAIPLKRQFDIIGAFDVLEHIKNDELALSEMCNAVKIGGGLILTVPQHDFLWSPLDEIACHERRYSRKELINKVTNAGFQVLKVSSFVTFLLPLLMLSRYRLRNLKKPIDVATEFKLSPIINKMFEYILAIERGLIQAGCDLPSGGSLIVIAKRTR